MGNDIKTSKKKSKDDSVLDIMHLTLEGPPDEINNNEPAVNKPINKESPDNIINLSPILGKDNKSMISQSIILPVVNSLVKEAKVQYEDINNLENCYNNYYHKEGNDIPKEQENIIDINQMQHEGNNQPYQQYSEGIKKLNPEAFFQANMGGKKAPVVEPKMIKQSDDPKTKQVISKDIYAKVSKEDLHLITECLKKCNTKYQSGMDAGMKDNNYPLAVAILTKTKENITQLSTILRTKPHLPKEFCITIQAKLLEKSNAIHDNLKKFIPLAMKQKAVSNQPLNKAMTSTTNPTSIEQRKPNHIEQKAPVKKNVLVKRDSSLPKPPINNKKLDSESKEAFEEKIEGEILMKDPGVKFSDIVGMKELKQIIYEIVVLPTKRSDLFTGLRQPQRGLLLFGPPGTGKTMIAKAIASECQSTFFNISASSLTSKWVGESEKTVRGLFQLAYKRSPAIIFIDEIESVLSKRTENDNEAAKRLKTEFLIQFDGLSTNPDSKLLVIAATNRPTDLDDALLRRLPKRVYCGPLDYEGRIDFIKTIMKSIDNNLKDNELKEIAKRTNNYSNSDLKELCRDAAYQPVRELTTEAFRSLEKFRPIVYNDFLKALNTIRATITEDMLKELHKWNNQYGVLN